MARSGMGPIFGFGVALIVTACGASPVQDSNVTGTVIPMAGTPAVAGGGARLGGEAGTGTAGANQDALLPEAGTGVATGDQAGSGAPVAGMEGAAGVGDMGEGEPTIDDVPPVPTAGVLAPAPEPDAGTAVPTDDEPDDD